MKLLSPKHAITLALLASFAPEASATFLTCTETVNSLPSVQVEQFPSTLSYNLTVTDAWCTWCATQDVNNWCHTLCPNNSSGVVVSESDALLAAFSSAAVPWTTTNPSWAAPFPFWIFGGGSVTTNVTFTLQSYADCVQRAAAAGMSPDAAGTVVVQDLFRVTWPTNGVPPYYADCSAQVTCKPPLGQTRTIGYFRTHPLAVAACVATPIGLGFMTIAAGDANTALGVFGANPGHYDDGTKRSSLDQSRVILARQLLGAICNGRIFGSAPGDPGLITAASTALASGTCTNLGWLAGQLDAFNNSGDTGANWFSNATPGTYADPTPRTNLACP